jgi:resuscitation-promoting factor RpfB
MCSNPLSVARHRDRRSELARVGTLGFRSPGGSRFARLATAIATAASVGVLVACSAQDDTGRVGSAAESPAPARVTAAAKPTGATPTKVASTRPTTQRKIVVETRTIPFQRVTVKDSSLEQGRTLVTTRGVRGMKRLTYEVTLSNGVQTRKRLLREVVVTRPIDQVTTVGTKVGAEPAGQCDPNYSGGCVPIASDVDCAGGSGNGPAYVAGPVTVVGSDIYDLDRDSDGIGCED